MTRLLGACAIVVGVGLLLGSAGAGDDAKKGKKGRGDAEATFKKLDKDGDGKLTKAELEVYFDRLKDKIGEEKAGKVKEAMLKRFDKLAGKDGFVTLDQFKQLRERGQGKGQFGNPEEIFKKLDKDNNGKLTKAELEPMFADLKDKFGEEKAAKVKEFMLKRFDKLAGDQGYLTLDQFKEMRSFAGKKKKKDI